MSNIASHKLTLWDQIQPIVHDAVNIKINMDDKDSVVSGETTGFDLIKLSKFKNKNKILALELINIDDGAKIITLDLFCTIASYINGIDIDATYLVTPVYFEQPQGKEIFWHSSAHILGYALENLYQALLLNGPPLAEGFYYDTELVDESKINMVDLQSELNSIISQDNKFERKEVTLAEAKEMFKYNKYKMATLEKLETSDNTPIISVYKCGNFIDLCHGPHIPNINLIKSININNVSSTHLVNIKRIKCISFPTTFQMDQHNAELKRRSENSHQVIGQKQKLFFFSELSPGSAFFLEHGTRMVNAMTQIMRKFYHKRGFKEVITPNIFKCDLYKTSGHYEHYRENMFNFNVEDCEWCLKPMNCPGHCVLFASEARSYNELPLRFADFGVLHRNELSGALHGMTRLRKFTQDDGHCFCTPDQIQQELISCIEFVRTVYTLFGFTISVELSTRPDDYAGELTLWDRAESILTDVLNKEFSGEWKLSPKNGAFYGPKTDFHIHDKFNRSFQTATIQLDFVMGEKFNLTYADSDNNQVRPVIIHRAIYGSIERFLALVIENYEGTYPLWLSPRQFIIIPVHHNFEPYCQEIYNKLNNLGYYVDLDNSDSTFNKKIALARAISNRYNYIIIIGQNEVDNNTITIKDINNKDTKNINLDDFLVTVQKEMITD